MIGKTRIETMGLRPVTAARGESQLIHSEEEEKSERRMPRLPEAKKDVVSCEKPWGTANRL
jgi:hypothetical protein